MNQFEVVEMKRPQVSTHDLSHEKKFTANMGKLIPILCLETLPGDKFQISTETLIRLQPMIAPIMHRINAFIHYFFVPNRIIWDEWEDFITGGKSGTLTPNVPKIRGTKAEFAAQWPVHSVADYMGIPVQQFAIGANNTFEFSQLPFRAYTQIYNDYYVDPNLGTASAFAIDSTNITVTTAQSDLIDTLRTRCWEKDYFTAILPNPQLGTQVTMPLGTSALVKASSSLADYPLWYKVGTNNAPDAGDTKVTAVNPSLRDINSNTLWMDPNSSLYADLSTATAATINDLRRSFALQRWMEKNARGGPRYFEQMRSHFGVISPDSRLQRAEYIGGGKMPIRISEVLQTSETETTAQGTMSGHGFTSGSNAFGRYRCEEHGFIIGILSVMPRTGYMQGIPRMFLKDDRFDHYWPEFANLGEEAVSTEEIYAQGIESAATFGYNPRYQEYRFSFDTVAGRLRTTQLDFWHMAQNYAALPGLNNTFVECVPTNRIWPVLNDYDEMIIQMYHNVRAIRPVVKYGTPI